MPGKDRHPLPASDEARDDEVPEGMRSEKGFGDDAGASAAAGADGRDCHVNPDGEPYGEGKRE